MALLAGYLVAGEALLFALEIVRTGGQALRCAGLAVFSGWAVTALCLSLGLLVGVPPTLVSAAVVWSALLVVAALLRRRGPGRARAAVRETSRGGKACAAAGVVAVVGYLVALLVRSWEPTGVMHADVWNQWLPKAKILYFLGSLDTNPGGFTSQFNPDYPPLDATSEALMFHSFGTADVLDLARLHWAIVAAFVFGVAAILAPRVRPAILWPSLAVLLLSPAFGTLAGSSLADEPLAMLIAMGGLTALVWLLERDASYLTLAGLFLAAATATKNEGLMLALVVVVSLALTREGRSRPRALFALAGAILAVHGAWRLWLAHHSVPRNPFYDLSDILHPGFLLGRIDRLGYALGQLVEQLTNPSRWLLLVPATLALAVLASRRSPPLAAFVISVVVLDTLGFASIYWLSRVDLHIYVDNTVDRLPAFIAVFCGAILPLLLATAAPERLVPQRGEATVEATAQGGNPN